MFSQFHHHHHHHLFTLPLFLFFLLPSAAADDRTALLNLSSAVRGHTRRWNQSDPTPCSWFGVTCDKTTGQVIQLRLPSARLSGQIPPNSVGNLTHLRVLSLRKNALSGSLPSDLSSCNELEKLLLPGNQFSGAIPAELNILTKLRVLYLENNNLTGSIPNLNNLPNLRKFNVSHNNLNGSIPSILNNFPSNSFLGNSLCGSPLPVCPPTSGGSGGNDGNKGKKLSAGAIAGIVTGSVVGLILIFVTLFIGWRIYSSKTTPRQVNMSPRPPASPPPEIEIRSPKPTFVGENSGLRNRDVGVVVQSGGNDGLVSFGNLDFSLEELLRASAEMLGKGTFGTTYKAYIESEIETEIEVVVKRLKNVCVNETEFREKVESSGVLVHENLMPIKAYFYRREEKLLLFDCMPMGSLHSLLHGNRGIDRAALTWEIRSKIALGAARGIEYLHSIGPNISHGNIKSSNILLIDSYDARVSEYGIAQLVSTNSTLILNGYCAPEVTNTHKISQKADVYSFGVLLLELLTGKAPTHALQNEEGVDLPRWVQSMVQENQAIDVFDPELVRQQNREEQMAQLLHLGTSCTTQHPDSRPSMVEVSRRVNEICG
ncbi:hypothetical protein CsSME_00043229 [Camellia sinensis var. sinensis]